MKDSVQNFVSILRDRIDALRNEEESIALLNKEYRGELKDSPLIEAGEEYLPQLRSFINSLIVFANSIEGGER